MNRARPPGWLRDKLGGRWGDSRDETDDRAEEANLRVEAVFDVGKQDFEVERLFQRGVRAEESGDLERDVAGLRLAATGDGDDLRGLGTLAENGQELEPVDARHENVDDRDVDLRILEELERNSPVSGFDHVVAALLEEFMEDVTELSLVIHDQQARFRHPESSGRSSNQGVCPPGA